MNHKLTQLISDGPGKKPSTVSTARLKPQDSKGQLLEHIAYLSTQLNEIESSKVQVIAAFSNIRLNSNHLFFNLLSAEGNHYLTFIQLQQEYMATQPDQLSTEHQEVIKAVTQVKHAYTQVLNYFSSNLLHASEKKLVRKALTHWHSDLSRKNDPVQNTPSTSTSQNGGKAAMGVESPHASADACRASDPSSMIPPVHKSRLSGSRMWGAAPQSTRVAPHASPPPSRPSI